MGYEYVATQTSDWVERQTRSFFDSWSCAFVFEDLFRSTSIYRHWITDG